MKRIKNILNILIVTITLAIVAVTYKSKTARAPVVTDTTARTEAVSQTAYAVTPPYAASPQTWTFGNQVWSDAIHIPECNKSSFTNSDISLQCCCKFSDAIHYYYNWVTVKKSATQLCPYPWRIPTKQDFDMLVHATTGKALADAWGYGGNVNFGIVVQGDTYGQYWSSTKSDTGSYDVDAYLLSYHAGDVYTVADFKCIGRQVRCVRQ
ncbi:MAG: fibrobacter succinogenes major paralogous domain-containing protein [Prevotellaceae bacterium]|jgi:hypothetical protein|nr:fibrobacter succinogenes major paralogous domain-containing protein [Prevotellaceae bacterium]